MTKRKARVVPGAVPKASPLTFEKKIDLPLALKLRIHEGLTHAQIAERFGVTREAVTGAFQRFTCLTDDPKQLEAYRANKLGVFETVEQAILERLLREVVSGKASVGDLARAMDTISKHVRLLAGQSTQNIGLLVQTLGDVHKDLDSALAPLPTQGAKDAQVIDNAGVIDVQVSE